MASLGHFVQNIDGKVTLTDNVAADVIAAQGSDKRIVITKIIVTNAHATTGTKVELRDGTTVRVLNFAASGGGGFAPATDGRPHFIGSFGNAITARCVTTGADVDVSLAGYVMAIGS